jgi:enoyl-CoA hydratase
VSTDDEMVLVEVEAGVALVTLNRPERRNALTAAMMRRVHAAVGEADAHDEVAAIVLTGNGESFYAGLDLDELGSTGENLVEGGKGPPVPVTTKPLIGAINGAAVAGGLELALHCDFLIVSERARFADTHARVGVIPGWGAAAWLPHIVGPRNALAMSLTARFVDADEALRLGLVSEVVAATELLPRAREVAAQIAGNDQPTVRALLALMRRTARVSVEDGLEIEAEATAAWAAQIRERDIAERRQSIFERNADG